MARNDSFPSSPQAGKKERKKTLKWWIILTPSLPQPVKFPGIKMHGRAYKQCIFGSYDASIFGAMSFYETPFMPMPEGKRKEKMLKGFKFPNFINDNN